jgi:hypothetical protein
MLHSCAVSHQRQQGHCAADRVHRRRQRQHTSVTGLFVAFEGFRLHINIEIGVATLLCCDHIPSAVDTTGDRALKAPKTPARQNGCSMSSGTRCVFAAAGQSSLTAPTSEQAADPGHPELQPRPALRDQVRETLHSHRRTQRLREDGDWLPWTVGV